jgi:hypothetical protein
MALERSHVFRAFVFSAPDAQALEFVPDQESDEHLVAQIVHVVWEAYQLVATGVEDSPFLRLAAARAPAFRCSFTSA